MHLISANEEWPLKASNQSVQRMRNRSLVLRSIYEQRRISRVDLSRATGLMKSSITNIVTELIQAGFIIEAEAGVSGVSGGRRPVYLVMNARYCCFLGLELQPACYRAVVLDLDGNVLLRHSGATAFWRYGFQETMQQIYGELQPMVDALRVPVRGICLGLPGLVDPRVGIVHRSVPLGLQEFPGDSLPNPWSVPIHVENDARCCAWAGLLNQGTRTSSDFIAVLLEFQEKNDLVGQDAGISVGFGMVLNGAVYYGQNGSAGEFKSQNWRRGNKSQFGIGDARLVEVSRDTGVLYEVVRELLANMIPLASIFSPRQIILCGEGTRVLPLVRQALETELKDSYLANDPGHFEVLASPYSEYSVAMGAAAKILVSLFNRQGLEPNLPSWEKLLEEAVS